MSRRRIPKATRKRFLKAMLILGGLAAIIVGTAALVARSQWFRELVRRKIVSTVETATGGKAEIGGFQFDWRQMRAEVHTFVLRGTEPADQAPLFRASSIAVGLKIVSALKRDVDIQYLDVAAPEIHLIIGPDGRTNLPGPKVKGNTPIDETILKLAIDRFQLSGGVFEIQSRGRKPFDLRGRNLNTRLLYEASGPRYRGDVSIAPLEVNWPGYPVQASLNLSVAMERNRLSVTSGRAVTGGSEVKFSGALEDLAAPHAAVKYEARVSLADVARVARVRELEGGAAEIAGNANWSPSAGLTSKGDLHAVNVAYRDSTVRLQGFRLEGGVALNESDIDVSSLRLQGNCALAGAKSLSSFPVGGQIADVALRGRDLTANGVALAVLGGSFHGQVRLADLLRYSVKGDIAGFEARRVVAMYSPENLPWDSLVSGSIQLEGALGHKDQLRATAGLTLAPAAQGAPVHGQINATYEARSGTLDLGRSTVTLPSSRADFSGAIGAQLKVHLETRDLNDILPAIGESAASIPVKLENGSAIFDGTVTGKLDQPQIAGHVTVTGASYQGKRVDSLAADVNASPDLLRVENASAARGSIRAQFLGTLVLNHWKTDDSSALSGSASVRNASIADLEDLIGRKDLPLSGTAGGAVQLSGTLGELRATGEVELLKGAIEDEPFDRFTGHVSYSGSALDVAGGRFEVGGKQVRVSAHLDHAAGRLDRGRLRFQVESDALALEQIRTLQKSRPGITGTVQATASGDVELSPGAKGQTVYRIQELHADVSGKGLQFSGQSLGDAHLTANSQGGALRAHLDSGLAGSSILGDGEWRMEGDYPGSATITLSKVDFAQLRAWLGAANGSLADRITGFAEGQVRVQGPLLKLDAITAELRIPTVEVRPAPGTPGGDNFVLRNAGPLVVRLANDTLTVESARLVGRATDLTIGGKATLPSPGGSAATANALDLRVNGKLDLAIVQQLDPDFTSTGVLTANATVRGSFDSPQVTGDVQFQNATFSLADFPNTVSNAGGSIAFNRTRATIQRFSGETGGGKISLSGFADYGGGSAVFQLQANAQQVRVRYPEGVSTVADATLNLAGTTDRSLLSGTVTVERTGFNPQSDFSSLIAQSAEPVRTPSARTGLLGGMSFDVQIRTSPDIQFQSSLTQDMQVDANLTMRGSPSNPALLGRIVIVHGQLVFYGTRFNINQGTIAFYNPAKVEPILNIDLETKARGIDVTLSVTGPLTKPNLTPRSDPPLQFSEIVALLATGRTPTSDPTLLAQQSSAPQSFQQTGASALLGQAIASPVAGRLQRFFGVSKLRIDPTLPGVENNPQARLTLEQQVTPDITFTYITNVTNSNPQVVRVEWAVSKQWSIVALREENGMFGLDFFFKRRF